MFSAKGEPNSTTMLTATTFLLEKIILYCLGLFVNFVDDMGLAIYCNTKVFPEFHPDSTTEISFKVPFVELKVQSYKCSILRRGGCTLYRLHKSRVCYLVEKL